MKFIIALILLSLNISCRDQNEDPVASEEKMEQKPLIEIERPEKSDAIEVTAPLFDEEVTSPLEINGRARGNWFFEAEAPVEIQDRDSNKIAESYIKAESEWMTTEFVEFSGTIEFDVADGERGFLVLKKANPSDLEENDSEFRIPILFSSK
ncbi:Gmad2 immunoglobulin-like domain-containing protein [Christiangramia echinicola]|uniref:Immunoglobulin-like domain of spore germination n=1 Tax=Christiangramia echinicola TaxID=279359 RepID=A0A1H1L743_9FLAO|nr:Gmad2 immunoglobulin-like domain-containing protein [Christiangramia echinicola]SDR70326.1 Immunoglobulin-like domain of spore germination [Christiangramia echinicola]